MKYPSKGLLNIVSLSGKIPAGIKMEFSSGGEKCL